MGRFDAQIAQIRKDIAQYGRGVAYLTFDGREWNSQVFEIEDDGSLFCKEYSGSEFTVSLDELDDLHVDGVAPEPPAPVEPTGPRPFTVTAKLGAGGGIEGGIAPFAVDLAGLPRVGNAVWVEDEHTVYAEVIAANAREATDRAFASEDFVTMIAERLSA